MLDWWKQSYLSLRCPLPINVNPFIGFDESVCRGGQISVASRLVAATAKFIHVRCCSCTFLEIEKPRCVLPLLPYSILHRSDTSNTDATPRQVSGNATVQQPVREYRFVRLHGWSLWLCCHAVL